MIFFIIDGTKYWSSISNLFKKTLKWKNVSAVTINADTM